MWCWRGMEKIIWTDRVRDGKVLIEEYPVCNKKKRCYLDWSHLT